MKLRKNKILDSLLQKAPTWALQKVASHITTSDAHITLDKVADKLYRCLEDTERKRPRIEIEEHINLKRTIDKLQATWHETSELATRVQERLQNDNKVTQALSWGSALSILAISATEVLLLHKDTDGSPQRLEVLKISRGKNNTEL